MTERSLALRATCDVEEWRPIVDWEGLYEVSDFGRVRSVARVVVCIDGRTQHWPERLRTLQVWKGYHCVSLYRAGRGSRYEVHQLVARAFLGPCPTGQETLHRDGVKLYNRPTNLRYGTHAENMADVVIHGGHYWANREVCDRGHRLGSPNARPGGRRCLACHRAVSNARYARRQGRAFDMAAAADRHYRQIMGEAA